MYSRGLGFCLEQIKHMRRLVQDSLTIEKVGRRGGGVGSKTLSLAISLLGNMSSLLQVKPPLKERERLKSITARGANG